MVIGLETDLNQKSSNYELTSSQMIECSGHTRNLRHPSRSVSWNRPGAYLAGTFDGKARIWTPEGREVLAISATAKKVRFHESHPSLLLTSDPTMVRLWDVRQATQKALCTISGTKLAVAEWSTQSEHILTTATLEGDISVHDTRQTSKPLGMHKLSAPVEAVKFSPCGSYIIAGTHELHVWDWENDKCWTNSAHSGAIYAMLVSKDTIVTGGADASVHVWDYASLSCKFSLSRRMKYIRGLSMEGPLLAACNQEDTIDVSETASGHLVGLVPLSRGAEEVAFRDQHTLACARCIEGASPVVIIKLSIR